METTSKLQNISDITSNISTILKGNSDRKKFRLNKQRKKQFRKDLDRAEDDLEDLQEFLAEDIDGYTDADKAMVKEAGELIAKQRLELIRLGMS